MLTAVPRPFKARRWVAVALPVVMIAGAVAAAPASASASRTSTFDAGNFSEWDYAPNVYGPGSPSVVTQSTTVCAGARAAQAHVGTGTGNKFARTIWGGSSGDAKALNWGEGADVWFGTSLFLPKGFNTAMQSYYVPMRWDNFGVSNVSRSGLAMFGDGSWRLFAEQDGIDPQRNLLGSTFRLAEGTWHTLEVHQKLSRTAGSALNELYVNGVKIGSSTAKNYYGSPVSAIRYGIVAIDQDRQSNALTVQYDSAYAGPTRQSLTCGSSSAVRLVPDRYQAPALTRLGRQRQAHMATAQLP